MSQATDLKRFHNLLRQAVTALHRPVRELESDLGISNGGLERLLDGRQDFRLRHLLAFARVLEVSPAELLELGCPDAHAGARRKVEDWVGSVEPTIKKKKQETPAAAPSAREIAELVRQTVREELALAAKPPAEESS